MTPPPAQESVLEGEAELRVPGRIETFIRVISCFLILAIFGAPGFLFFLFPRGKHYLIWYWLPWWGWANLWLLGIRVKIRGRHNLEAARPCIFVSNHQGVLDIFSLPAIFCGIPMFYVVKREFRYYPFIGQLGIFSDQVFIDREARNGPRASLVKAEEKLRSGMCTVMFPEGRRYSDGRLHKFKLGAFWLALQTRVPIVPVTLVNSNVLLPNKTFKLKQGTLEIVIGEPIESTSWTDDDIPRVAEQVREILADNLGVPPEPPEA